MAPLDRFSEDDLITKVVDYVKSYMASYDASHDWSHILRVVGLAHEIYHKSTADGSSSELSLRKITLAALLHDVGDKKYLKPGEDSSSLIHDCLLDNGADEALATEIQAICLGVSYSSEIKDLDRVVDLIAKYPELAVVQDADRLDAIGAIGVGRCFTFTGAKNNGRGMHGAVEHFDDKLLKLSGMMKTDTGRVMAEERTERMRIFKEWWQIEAVVGEGT